jgi:PHD/YefM family antitoxin component YafN of YafNO toxin-antitoxin module
MLQQILSDEKFTNIQRAQAGLTKLFEKAGQTLSFYRVMKNDEPVGVLVPTNVWDSIIEDIEALTSSAYRARIAKARGEKTRYSAASVKKKLGL